MQRNSELVSSRCAASLASLAIRDESPVEAHPLAITRRA
jgi:hypothetical protein